MTGSTRFSRISTLFEASEHRLPSAGVLVYVSDSGRLVSELVMLLMFPNLESCLMVELSVSVHIAF